MEEINKIIEHKLTLLRRYIDSKEADKKLLSLEKSFRMIYANAVHKNMTRTQLLEQMAIAGIQDELNKYIKFINDTDALEEFKRVDIPVELNLFEDTICEFCSMEMIISTDEVSLECPECLNSRYNPAIYQNVEATSRATTSRSKIGNFNPERHFKTWFDRILARESEDELRDKKGNDIVEKIRKTLISKKKSSEHLTIDDIRKVLKELDATHLNKNTSLIAKKITGRGPPRLSDDIFISIYMLFLRVMEARDKLSINNRCNRIYYPYYIAKIMDVILVEEEDRKVLNYVHLHKSNTLASNDLEWEEICDILHELRGKYKPTIISETRYI